MRVSLNLWTTAWRLTPRPRWGDATPLFLEEILQRRLHTREFGYVFCDVGALPRLEVVAKIRLVLFSHLLRRRLPAMLRIRGVVLNAHLANVQLRIARLADLETTERQCKRGQRPAATPAD
jgi:hypothetical protein